MPAIVIVGGSVAGVRVARALRQHEYDGPITILEAERHEPYDKPPLSKQATPDPVVPLLTAGEAAQLRLDLRLGMRVTALNRGGRCVVVSGSSDAPREFGYDSLVIATGVCARPAPWSVPGLLVLRTRDDALELRARLEATRHLLIIGGGFIGTEVASMAHALGVTSTIVDVDPNPMDRTAGGHVAGTVRGLLDEHGSDVRFGVGVEDITYDGARYRATLTDGTAVLADTIVVGIGTALDHQWLRDAGLPLDDGILCDDRGAIDGFDDCYAVGDVARWSGENGRASRVEHWTNAVDQANVVAWNLTHPDEPRRLETVPYVWSDQFGVKLQIAGRCSARPSTFAAYHREGARSISVWADDDRVVGVSTVSWPRLNLAVRRSIAQRDSIDQVRAVIAENGGVEFVNTTKERSQ